MNCKTVPAGSGWSPSLTGSPEMPSNGAVSVCSRSSANNASANENAHYNEKEKQALVRDSLMDSIACGRRRVFSLDAVRLCPADEGTS